MRVGEEGGRWGRRARARRKRTSPKRKSRRPPPRTRHSRKHVRQQTANLLLYVGYYLVARVAGVDGWHGCVRVLFPVPFRIWRESKSGTTHVTMADERSVHVYSYSGSCDTRCDTHLPVRPFRWPAFALCHTTRGMLVHIHARQPIRRVLSTRHNVSLPTAAW